MHGVGDHSHGEILANLFFDLFLLADVAGSSTLSSLGRGCVGGEREILINICHVQLVEDINPAHAQGMKQSVCVCVSTKIAKSGGLGT